MWAVKVAPTLAEGGRITEKPANVPIDVTLQRWPQGNGPRRLLVQRFLPPDLEAKRAERVRTALQRKLPKLLEARSRFQATESILILESDDIALANASVIVTAVDSELQAREDKPDTIFIVESELGSTSYLSIAKEKGDTSAKVRDEGPIEITLHAAEGAKPVATGNV